MGCGASGCADKPLPQGAPSAAAGHDPGNGLLDRATYTQCLLSFTDVFTAIATPGCHAAVVAQDGGLSVSIWTDHRDLHSGYFTKAALAIKRVECGCSWDTLFAWLQPGSIRAASFAAGSLRFQESPALRLPRLRAPLDLEVDSIVVPTQTLRAVLHPLVEAYLRLRKGPREDHFTAVEIDQLNIQASHGEAAAAVATLQDEIASLRADVARVREAARAAKERRDGVMKWIARLRFITESYDTDVLYPSRPSCSALHLPQAQPHVPCPIPFNPHALHRLQLRYGVPTTEPLPDPAPDCHHDTIIQQLGRIDSWDYDVFGLTHSTNRCPLFFTAYDLLHRHALVARFGIAEGTLHRLLQVIEAGYHPNPYHNNVHAADVVQCLHYILTTGGLKRAANLQPLDLLAALLAAAIHDYDHPGFNNNFHVRTQAYLATLYNDRSVLENHHVASVFELMKDPKYNILAALSWDQYRDVRDTMLEMVLATDMGLHSRISNAFKQRLIEDKGWDTKADQRLSLSIALKVADISNCSRAPQFYNRWARCIVREFYIQGDAERAAGLAVSPYMDRAADTTDFAAGQISFMNYIVIPLGESLAELLPDMAFAVDNCLRNREMLTNPT